MARHPDFSILDKADAMLAPVTASCKIAPNPSDTLQQADTKDLCNSCSKLFYRKMQDNIRAGEATTDRLMLGLRDGMAEGEALRLAIKAIALMVANPIYEKQALAYINRDGVADAYPIEEANGTMPQEDEPEEYESEEDLPFM